MKTVCFVLICFLWCLNGVLCGEGCEERNKVTLKIGENVTLQLPVNDSTVGEIEHVIWTKENDTLLCINNTDAPLICNTSESRIYSNHISSITICNATGNDTGMYKAQIQYKNETNKPTKNQMYYVAEHLNFCDGTTNRNEIKGDNVTLPVKKDPAEHSWWSKNNINVTGWENGPLSILNVTKEDEGNYIVHVKKNLYLCPCNHTYILSISTSRALCGVRWEERINVTLKVGENVTLQLPVNYSAVGEIKHVMWMKEKNMFLRINKSSAEFTNNTYQSIICSYNISSITICNATGNDTGMYTAQMNPNGSKNQPKNPTFYVAEHLEDFCNGTTNRNEIKGDTGTLPVEKDPAEHSWCSKNKTNITGSDSVLCGTGWEKRIKVTLKIGENVTLQFPVNDSAVREIKHVIWTKENYTLLHIKNTDAPLICNTYQSRICSCNISSITICNATGNNTGMYTAQVTYENKSKNRTENETFCVNLAGDTNWWTIIKIIVSLLIVLNLILIIIAIIVKKRSELAMVLLYFKEKCLKIRRKMKRVVRFGRTPAAKHSHRLY